MNNKEDIKMFTVFGSLVFGTISTIIGIVAFIQYNNAINENDYLRKQIEQQNMLIEYLKGDNNENRK